MNVFVRITGLMLAWGLVVCGFTQAGELTDKIDQQLAATWQAAVVKPVATTDDATFLRRITLDLVGRIPLPSEITAFQQSTAPDKRRQAIDRLLNSPGYVRYWSAVWRHSILPQGDTPRFAAVGASFESWLQSEFAQNRPINQLTLATLAPPDQNRAASNFQAASEFKPELLAANTARAYLGLNIDCAQCHDHPFASWSRLQFWSFAAFFAKPATVGMVASNSETEEPAPAPAAPSLNITIPGTEITVEPALLVPGPIAWPEALADHTGKQLLAQWIVQPDNPFFSRNVVNRVWAQLFGTGLVEPLDDLSDFNLSLHSDLLQDLALDFVKSGYDMKYLIREITSSQAYQLTSSQPAETNNVTEILFHHMQPRGLSGEQLFDSILVAAGETLDHADPNAAALSAARTAFVERFPSDRRSTEERSVLQTLELMNGPLTTTVQSGKLVHVAAESPWLDAAGRLKVLYSAALGREPTTIEQQEFVPLLDHKDATQRLQNTGNVFWVLLNSAEFSVNR